jgi:hypothetical protein
MPRPCWKFTERLLESFRPAPKKKGVGDLLGEAQRALERTAEKKVKIVVEIPWEMST